MNTFQRRLILSLAAGMTVCLSGAARADGDDFAYSQTNLVSDGAVAALMTDTHLKNPWGIANFPGGPFWIADNGAGLSTLYDGGGNRASLVVTIPPPSGSAAGTHAAPTGIVFNPNPRAFLIGTQQVAPLFIFATEDGTVSAWNPTVSANSAVLQVDNSEGGNGAVYKGLALASNSSGIFLYATNFRAGTVDVFDSRFQPAKLSGSFSDPRIPAGYAPFGIALIDGNLFVTYALQDSARHDDVKGAGHGFVDVFDTDGHLVGRFASRGALNSPWGVARAPLDFGPFGARILIGNFGDGRINGFSSFGQFAGQLRDTHGHAISIDGLWSIAFGTASAAEPDTLYFTAGANDEADGLFGFLQAVRARDHDSDDR
jgi:uncharacterized protein (TIGR03118 family)